MIKMFTKRMKNKKGFTLVELIVVIAILGVLAAIAVPRLTSATSDAQDAAEKATARTILSAVSMAEAKNTSDDLVSADQINEFLNDPISTDTDGEGWEVRYDETSKKWTVYKDGEEIDLNSDTE